MARTLVIDLNRCSGCDTCQVACKIENKVSLGNYWNRVYPVGPTGMHPDIEMYWLPMQCQQCENPACVDICPTGASYRDPETGVILVEKETCIGCQACMSACPYNVRNFNEEENVVEKCTLCNQRTADGSSLPACVVVCPTGARAFGDIDDPDSDASKMLAAANEEDIHTLLDDAATHPTARYILSKKIATWQDFA